MFGNSFGGLLKDIDSEHHLCLRHPNPQQSNLSLPFHQTPRNVDHYDQSHARQLTYHTQHNEITQRSKINPRTQNQFRRMIESMYVCMYAAGQLNLRLPEPRAA